MSALLPIRIAEELASAVRKMHPAIKKRIHQALEQLRQLPGEGKPLQRELAGYRSFRVGRFRIIYRMAAKEIEVVAIGPRSAIYEEMERLLRRK